MVVDAELEALRKSVLELTKEKDRIENEIEASWAVLHSNGVGMDEALVDADDFPRNDIDVYRVRHARHKIICLQNDHRELMKKIEQGLAKVYGGASSRAEQSDQATMAKENPAEDSHFLGDPFLRVNLVSPGSPAEAAGIRLNDRVVEFGSINYQNFKSLKDIGSLVEHSRYKPIIVRVKRETEALSLTLIPRPWSGKGLLGCNVIPLEMVER